MKEKKENNKHQLLLKAGRSLFWKYGFIRLSVDEICREANVSKMTFYRCFENKTDLAKSVFLQMVNEGIVKFNEIMEADLMPSEKLRKIITLKMEGTDEISRDFIMDFYNSPDAGLKVFVEETTKKSWDELINSFRMAQEKGWFRKDFKPEFLLFVTQKLSPIITDENLLKMYNSQQELIMEFANFFTYGIAPHK